MPPIEMKKIETQIDADTDVYINKIKRVMIQHKILYKLI